MGYLIDILIGTASRIVTGELSAHVEPFARWVINKGAERLPVEVRDRFREEWLAHMDETPGALRKLWHAMGCRLGAIKVGDVLRQPRRPTQMDESTRESLRTLRSIVGDAGFDRVVKHAIDAVIDAVADLEGGRRSYHETISMVAEQMERVRWQTHEPWGRRLYRQWRNRSRRRLFRRVCLGAHHAGTFFD
jgi:hypothetical protein